MKRLFIRLAKGLGNVFQPRNMLFVAFGGAALTCATVVSAQATAAKPPIPPKLKTFVEPDYPKEKLAAGERGEVVLLLSVSRAGTVFDAKVTTSAGADFDGAALAAASKLEFDPATLDGKPIVAKIPFRYRFDFKDIPKRPSEIIRPATGSLKGLVKTPADEPLVGARIRITQLVGKPIEATTDERGMFSVGDLPVGILEVEVTFDKFKPYKDKIEVFDGKVTDVVYRPSFMSTKGDSIDIDVKGERPAREVTVRKLEREELTRIPGTNGDALRALQNLPGVARAPGLAGLLIVRGSSPNDTNVFVDGTLIPIAYHFGGLSSVIPSEMLDRIDFYPGNFSPEYGRVMGGIVDIGLRSPNREHFAGLAQIDLIDFRFFVEGPIDKKTRFSAAARRSWVDAWLGPILKSAGTGVSTAPRYYDYQLMLERDLTDKTTARLAFFGSNDALALTLDGASASDPAIGGNLGFTTTYWRIQGRAETRLSPDLKWINTVAIGKDSGTFDLGPITFRFDTYPVSWKSDVRGKITKDISAIVGVDWLWVPFDVYVKAPPAPPDGADTGPFFARPSRESQATGRLYRPALYALLDLTPIPGMKLLPGVRIDYTKDTKSWDISPRVAFRYDVHRGYPRTTIKGGLGLFMQPPQPQESIPPFGTAGIANNRATHISLGFEQEFSKQIELSVEGFYKNLQSLVNQAASENSTSSGNSYGNQGSGRVVGGELLLRYKPDDKFFGWVAYTLSRSERKDNSADTLHTFQFDQTHILTILGSYKLGRGWQIGARFRYTSGNMYTDNRGGLVDFDAGAYSPIPQTPAFTSRLPAFQQLDFRVDKTWQFQHWKLGAYLDLQNATNHGNPEGVTYNYNYSKSSIITGLPILPVFGLRGEL